MYVNKNCYPFDITHTLACGMNNYHNDHIFLSLKTAMSALLYCHHILLYRACSYLICGTWVSSYLTASATWWVVGQRPCTLLFILIATHGDTPVSVFKKVVRHSSLYCSQVSHPSELGLEVGHTINVKYYGQDPTSGHHQISHKALLSAPAAQTSESWYRQSHLQQDQD